MLGWWDSVRRDNPAACVVTYKAQPNERGVCAAGDLFSGLCAFLESLRSSFKTRWRLLSNQ